MEIHRVAPGGAGEARPSLNTRARETGRPQHAAQPWLERQTSHNTAMPYPTRPQVLRTLLALFTAFSTCLVAAQAGGKGIGFSLQISADGIFNPKVAKAVVKAVEAGSQAQAAGLAVGDELIQVEGVQVPGAKASELKPHMEFEVGKPKKLVLRRPDGKEYEVTLTKG